MRISQIKFEKSHCDKCKGKLEIHMDAILDDEKEPTHFIVHGTCHKCNVIYMQKIVEAKDVMPTLEE